jgi:AMP nucleosidase
VKTKVNIVQDWLPRYTGRPLEAFGPYILLTNFVHYVDLFARSSALATAEGFVFGCNSG